MKKTLFLIFVIFVISCQEKSGKKVKVKKDTKEVLFSVDNEIKDKTAKNLFHEGLEKVDEGNYEEANEKFIEADKIEAKNPIILNGIAQTESSLGNMEKSIQISLNVISIDSNYIETYVNLGQNYMQRQDYVKAKEILFKGLRFANKTSQYTKSILLLNLAVAHRESGDCINGLKYINEAIEISRDREFKDYAEKIKRKCEDCI